MFTYVQYAHIGNVTLRNPDIESAFRTGSSIAPIVVFGLGKNNNIYGNQLINDTLSVVEPATLSSQGFIPPPPGTSNIMETFTEGDEEVFKDLGITEELGITTRGRNIYYYGELVHRIVFYSHYEGGGWFVYWSNDCDESNLTVYARLNNGSSTSTSLNNNSVAYLNAVRR